VTYRDMIKRRGGPLAVERRQEKLAANSEALERELGRLVRIVNRIDRLRKERKRLLNPRKETRGGKALDWTPDKYIGSGGPGAEGGLDDSLEDL